MRRRGSAIIEWVVVLGIVVTILGLAIPAIARAREAARRTQCANNLNQIGLALQNYLTQHGTFPPGVVDDAGPVRNDPNGLRIGWLPQILPFLDYEELYDRIDFNLPVTSPSNGTLFVTRIGVFLCPSDPSRNPSPAPALTTYAGCHHDVEAPIDADNHGLFFLNSVVGPGDVPDGFGYTIALGEKRLDGGELGWASGTASTLRNTGSPINADPATLPAAGDPLLRVGGFSSFHPGGANFAFGDGSVRFLSQGIRPDVYRLLGHRADGELIGADGFHAGNR